MTIIDKKFYDAGIVLGHFYSGFSSTSRQTQRLNKAVSLFKAGKIKYIITTGGKGLFYKKSPCMAMLSKDYLIKKGIDAKRIFPDELSTNTAENAKYSLQIVKNKHLRSVTVITSSDHIKRALEIFQNIYPEDIELDGEISDTFSGIWSIFDFFWHTLGNIKRLFVHSV